MNVRTCPKCNFRLGNSDHYFCTNCGEVLPANLINPKVLVKVKSYTQYFNAYPESTFYKAYEGFLKYKSYILNSKSSKMYVLVAALLVFGLFFAQISKIVFTKIGYSTNSGGLLAKQSNQSRFSNRVITSTLNLNSKEFGKDYIADYIPAKSQLYIELNDLPDFLNYVSGSDKFKALIGLFSPHAGIFKLNVDEKLEWGVILYPINPDNLKNLDTTKAQAWKFKYADNVLVMSTTEKIFQIVADTKSKYALSLSLSPKYVQAKSLLPKEGKILVMYFTDDGFKAFSDLKEVFSNQTLKQNVDAVIKSGYNEVVLN